MIYNSGRYRMAGRGSLAGLLAYGNANDIVVEMAREVLPVVRHTPVLAGVNGTDPFMLLPQFLRQLADLGFSGVQNFPSVGLIDGTFRANLEETGMGYALEVDMIRAARALDLLTTPYVFRKRCARDGARRRRHRRVPSRIDDRRRDRRGETALTSTIACRASMHGRPLREVNPDIIVLCHGGPIATPEDAQTFFSGARNATASTAHRAWSACRRSRADAADETICRHSKRKKALESVASSLEVALKSAPKDVEHRKRKIEHRSTAS